MKMLDDPVFETDTIYILLSQAIIGVEFLLIFADANNGNL